MGGAHCHNHEVGRFNSCYLWKKKNAMNKNTSVHKIHVSYMLIWPSNGLIAALWLYQGFILKRCSIWSYDLANIPSGMWDHKWVISHHLSILDCISSSGKEQPQNFTLFEMASRYRTSLSFFFLSMFEPFSLTRSPAFLNILMW